MNRKIRNLKDFKAVEHKIEQDSRDLYMRDVLYEYHCNPSRIVPYGKKRIGIELESQENKVQDVLKPLVFGVSNCEQKNIYHLGYENSPDALWDSTRDGTASIEFVSVPINSHQAPTALANIYNIVDIKGDKETGNHYHVNGNDLESRDMFGLLAVYLAPELKKASRRNFVAWNEWSACRYKTLEDIDDMLYSYFEEMSNWEHPLVRPSYHCPTMELRCFTTSSNLRTAINQWKAFDLMVDIANKVYRYLDYSIESYYFNDESLNFIESYIEEEIDKTNLYDLLESIAED